MQLELGRHAFDITSRTLVIADLCLRRSTPDIESVVQERPAVLAVHDLSQLVAAKAAFDGPIIICSTSAAVVEECLRAGASGAHDRGGLGDPNYLRVIEEADAAIIVSCPAGVADRVAFLVERAGWAEADALAKSRIVLDATGVSDEERSRLAALGYALMVTTTDELDVAGRQVLAAMHGVRLIVAVDVRAARRTLDTVAELLDRRMVSA